MPGWEMISRSPVAAITTNQMIITGPNSRADLVGAPMLDGEQQARMTAPIGSTRSDRPGDATLIPSTADSTEMAGVITLSP